MAVPATADLRQASAFELPTTDPARESSRESDTYSIHIELLELLPFPMSEKKSEDNGWTP